MFPSRAGRPLRWSVFSSKGDDSRAFSSASSITETPDARARLGGRRGGRLAGERARLCRPMSVPICARSRRVEAWPSPTTRSSARAIGHERRRPTHQRPCRRERRRRREHASRARGGAREDLPEHQHGRDADDDHDVLGHDRVEARGGPRSPRRSRAKAYRVTSGAKRRRPIFFSRLLGRAKGAQPPFSVRARLGPRRAGPRSGPPSYPPPAPERRRRARTRSCANRAAARRVARRGGRRRRRRARLGRKKRQEAGARSSRRYRARGARGRREAPPPR